MGVLKEGKCNKKKPKKKRERGRQRKGEQKRERKRRKEKNFCLAFAAKNGESCEQPQPNPQERRGSATGGLDRKNVKRNLAIQEKRN